MHSKNISRLFTSLATVAFFSLSGSQALALSASKAPGQNFDLSNFDLQAWPCSGGNDTTISQPQLATFQNSSYFYTGSDGSMVMWCPDEGGCETSTNTAHLRTELSDQRTWFSTDGLTHVETATCKVLQQPLSGSTIIGQIHGTTPSSGSEALKLRWMVGGNLVVGNKTTVSGTENYSQFVPAANAKIGDTLAYTLQEKNHVVTVTITINGGSPCTYSYTLDSTWDNDPLYFKAGNYNQDDVDGTTDGALVAFYALQSGTVTAPPAVAAPVFSPGGGSYTSSQNVSISDSTSGASIRYTTDGSTPSETAGTLYSGAVAISNTGALKAIGYKTGDTDSSITSATYTIRSLTGTATNGFQTLAISPAQTGTFTVTFSATPSASPENGLVGLSSGAATSYTTIACIARFNPTGQIDAYNGTAYAAASSINYSAGLTYKFSMVVNLSAHTYSVYVTPPGGSQLTVGLNYAFRSTANTMTSLNTWDVDENATPAGASLTAINLRP